MKYFGGHYRGHRHRTHNKDPERAQSVSTTVVEQHPIPVKRVSGESTSFVAKRAVDSMLGVHLESGRSLVLIFDGEVAARRADERRAERPRYTELSPEQLMLFEDRMAALEWSFPDSWRDDDVFEFCKIFEEAGVKVCLAGGCSVATQRLILGLFGMQQGMSL